MKKNERRLSSKASGFSLVEMLIVVVIIIILTCIGLVVYTNIQRSARDAKRKADVKAISQALENQYLTTGIYTTSLTGENFASGDVPAPVEGGSYVTNLGQGNAGFQVCAALENHPAGTECDTNTSTCYCLQSTQEAYVAAVPIATPTPTTAPTGSPTNAPTPTTGPILNITKFPGTATNTTGYGTIAWVNPGNIFSEDGAYSMASIGSHGTMYTNYLDATNFSFNIPSGATINGIKVEIKKESHYTTPIVINDDKVLILKGGSMGSVNKAVATNWSTAGLAYTTYGDQNDLWGEVWTSADINSPTFGVRLSAKATLAFAWVDAVKITVYYTN